MAVALSVLSGPSRGQREVADRSEFLLAVDTDGRVHWQEPPEGFAGMKKAIILQDPSGWQIKNPGPQSLFINRTELPPTRSVRLRSADVIRFSELGPDVRCEVLTGVRLDEARASESPKGIALAPAVQEAMPTHPPRLEGFEEKAATSRPEVAQRSRRTKVLAMAMGASAAATILASVGFLFWRGSAPPSSVQTGAATGAANLLPTDTKPEARRSADTPKSIRADPRPVQAASPQELLSRSSKILVWIGVEPRPGIRYAYASGWALDARHVATTAHVAIFVEACIRHKDRVFAVANDASDQVVAITGVRIHPLYNRNDRAEERSRHYNVGVLEVDRVLSGSAARGTREEFSSLRAGAELVVIGHDIDQSGAPVALEPLQRPKAAAHVVRVQRCVVCGDGSSDMPRYELRYEVVGSERKACDGAMVVAPSGSVVGILWKIGDSAVAVNASHLDSVADSGTGSRPEP